MLPPEFSLQAKVKPPFMRFDLWHDYALRFWRNQKINPDHSKQIEEALRRKGQQYPKG